MENVEKFKVIRFLIALAHYDGEFSVSEKAVVKEQMKWTELSTEQKGILSQEIANPLNPMTVFEEITDAKTKRICLEVGRVLVHACYADDDEKYLLEHLTTEHFKTVKFSDAYKELHEVMKSAKKLSDLKAENNKLTKEKSFWRSLAYILRFS